MKILKDEKENFTMKTNKYSGTKTDSRTGKEPAYDVSPEIERTGSGPGPPLHQEH